MNTEVLRSRKVIAGLAVTLVLLGGGATALVIAENSSDQVTGSERDRISRATADQVPGSVIKVERDDSDHDSGAFEVKVKGPDGKVTEVTLDKDHKVLRTETDDDFVPMPLADRSAAEAAALAAVPGGTVTSIERTDDHGASYEVDVTVSRGNRLIGYEVYLDQNFRVVHKERDR